MRNDRSWTPCAPPCRAVGTRGQLWPRARPVRSGEHSSEHRQTRAKMTSGTLNVAGTGPLAGDFRAPVLGLHCRCPYGTTLGKAHAHVLTQCTTSGQKPQTTLALSLVGLNERAGCQQRQQVEVTPTGRRERKRQQTHMHDGMRQWGGGGGLRQLRRAVCGLRAGGASSSRVGGWLGSGTRRYTGARSPSASGRAAG